MAHRLIWNRTCNSKGGEGKNVSLDLQNKHLNRNFKDAIRTLRANISDMNIARSSQAVGPMSEMLTSVDKMVHVKTPSGRHAGPSVKSDLKCMLKVLVDEEVFTKKDKHKHSSFSNLSSDPFVAFKAKPVPYFELHHWLVQRRQAASIEHQLQTGVF